MADATINYNAVLLGTGDYGVTVLNTSELPPSVRPRIDTQPVPYGGGISQGRFDDVLVFSVHVMVEGSTPDILETRLRNIGFVFNQPDNDVNIFFPNTPFADRQWVGRLSNMSQPFNRTLTSKEFDYEFTMAQPISELIAVTTQNVAPAGAPHAFTVPAAGVVAGNIEVFPTYTFTATGAVSNITLVNVTQGVTMQWTAALANTNVLEINTRPNIMSVLKSTDAGATFSSSIANMVQTGFPSLTAQVSNSFTVLGANNTALAITYQPRFTSG